MDCLSGPQKHARLAGKCYEADMAVLFRLFLWLLLRHSNGSSIWAERVRAARRRVGVLFLFFVAIAIGWAKGSR